MQPGAEDPHPAAANRAASPSASASKRARNVLIGLVAAVLGLGASYWVGRAEGAARTAAVEQQAEQQQAADKKRTDNVQGRLSQAERRLHFLEARVALHRALLALELDNYGTAREHLAKAQEWAKTQKPVPGSPLSEFERALAKVELTPKADSVPQRLALSRLATEFDKLPAE